MRDQEKVTMYVDFSHLNSFDHQDPNFMSYVVKQYNKFEPDMRKGLIEFMKNYSNGDA